MALSFNTDPFGTGKVRHIIANYFAFLSKLSFVPHLLLSNLVQIFPSHIIVALWHDKDIKGVFFIRDRSTWKGIVRNIITKTAY